MPFPQFRARRLRNNAVMRRLVQETRLSPSDFIYPMFVSETIDEPEPIVSMPGIVRFPIAGAADEADRVYKLGVPGIILFGLPSRKDATGSSSIKKQGVVQQAIQRIKGRNPDVLVITDVCLCEYTDHGHCGILKNGEIDNDSTLEVLAQQAITHAASGADMVAPSDMMDGRVKAIRDALDTNGFQNTPIMSYAAKYSSAFYGPFRDAAGSTPQSGDRKSHQMDPANMREALKEVQLDVEEGADIVMVKPALSYLDVIQRVREITDLPLAAYNVSGEYSMVKQAALTGVADEKALTLEILTSIKRAGADIIISYHAPEAAEWLD